MDHKVSKLLLIIIFGAATVVKANYSTTYLFSGICWHNIKHRIGRVFTEHTEGSGYPRDMNCKVTIISPDDRYRVMISFETFDLYASDGCTVDYVNIFDGDNTYTTPLLNDENPLCGNSTPPFYLSTGSTITLQLITAAELPDGTEVEGQRKPHGFSFVYNTFIPYDVIEDDVNNTMGLPGQFCCETDDVCIDSQLVCDDVNNCPDQSDETDTLRCLAKKSGLDKVSKFLDLSLETTIGIAVGSFLFLILIIIMIILICCCCCCRRCQDKVKETKDYFHSEKSYDSSYASSRNAHRYKTRPYVISGYRSGPTMSDSGLSSHTPWWINQPRVPRPANTRGASQSKGISDTHQSIPAARRPKPHVPAALNPTLYKDAKTPSSSGRKRSRSSRDDGFESDVSLMSGDFDLVYYKLYHGDDIQ
ncbi:uncharacterized protein LOC144351932 [Saccoglossus kowalevskii]